MLKKRIVVYLDTGASKEHEIHTKDEADYKEKVVACAKALMENKGDILQCTTPFCIYKIQNVAAIEFLDPPSEKPNIGFRLSS
jgi:hypothetical protein